MSPAVGRAARAQALAGRLFEAGLGAAELMTVYLGLKLGLYTALDGEPATPEQLAARGGIASRYAREWLEQQAAAGILEVDDAERAPHERCYSLPPGHADALVRTGPFAVAPFTLMPVGGMGAVLPQLIEAYRAGTGVDYAAYGPDFRGGQAGLNENVFRRQLPGWIRRHLPGLDTRLREPGAKAADIACGSGLSSVALAAAYPDLVVHGVDLDDASVRDATGIARREGLAGRVTFRAGDAAAVRDLRVDLVCLFDALHDMADPVAVLRGCRGLLAPGAPMLLMEPRVQERFTAPADETERFFHAVSLLHCLPVGLADGPSAATGTMIRPEIVRRYAADAGFADVEVLDVAHRFHRLYVLRT